MKPILEKASLFTDNKVRVSPDVGHPKGCQLWTLEIIATPNDKAEWAQVSALSDLYYYWIKNRDGKNGDGVFISGFGSERTEAKPYQVRIHYDFKIVVGSAILEKIKPFIHINLNSGEEVMAKLKTAAPAKGKKMETANSVPLSQWTLESLKAACKDLGIPENSWKNVTESHRNLLERLLSKRLQSGQPLVRPAAAEEPDEEVSEFDESANASDGEFEDDLEAAFSEEVVIKNNPKVAKSAAKSKQPLQKEASMPAKSKPASAAPKGKPAAAKKASGGGGSYPLKPDEIHEAFRRGDGRVNMKLVKLALQNAGKWESAMTKTPLVERYQKAFAIFKAKGKLAFKPVKSE